MTDTRGTEEQIDDVLAEYSHALNKVVASVIANPHNSEQWADAHKLVGVPLREKILALIESALEAERKRWIKKLPKKHNFSDTALMSDENNIMRIRSVDYDLGYNQALCEIHTILQGTNRILA